MGDFARYLAAKRTVDDRALNRPVWERLRHELATSSSGQPLRVLEIGAGVGTMVQRAVEWGLLERAEYTAVDAEAGHIAAARSRLRAWARAQGLVLQVEDGRALPLSERGRSLCLELHAADAFAFARQAGERRWDLLIAHAFLDLVDIPASLPPLLSLLTPGGLFYFSLVFDGVTSFQPEIEPSFDARVEALYHHTMDKRTRGGRPSGDSRSGRHLFEHIRASGAELLAAGPSDWVVFAAGGRYTGDEAYFLHFILDTVQRALAGHPQLDDRRFQAWIEQRRAQIERGELVYIAHQLDFLGRVPGLPAASDP